MIIFKIMGTKILVILTTNFLPQLVSMTFSYDFLSQHNWGMQPYLAQHFNHFSLVKMFLFELNH